MAHHRTAAEQILIVESFKTRCRRPNANAASGSNHASQDMIDRKGACPVETSRRVGGTRVIVGGSFDTYHLSPPHAGKRRRTRSPARHDADLMIAQLSAHLDEGQHALDDDTFNHFLQAFAATTEGHDSDEPGFDDPDDVDQDDANQAGVQIDDPLGAMLAKVLLVVPDVLPLHAHDLLAANLDRGTGAVDYVVGILLEEGTYPKVDEQQAAANEPEEEDWLDVEARMRNGDKPTPHYKQHA